MTKDDGTGEVIGNGMGKTGVLVLEQRRRKSLFSFSASLEGVQRRALWRQEG